MKKIIIIAAVFLLVPFPSLACEFNTDCNVGSVCVKPGGGLYGYCIGGMNPGNSNDRVPVYNPLDLTGKQGNTCKFDTNCGVSGKCIKSDYSLYGTCF